MELAELKSQLIMKVKNYYTETIYRTYPIWKQTNIIRAGGGDLTTMSSFIDGKLADIIVVETDINNLTDTEMYDSFTTNSDANMMSYVLGYLPNLTTDEQKLSVVTAIQCVR
jgi:hypothetical protein